MNIEITTEHEYSYPEKGINIKFTITKDKCVNILDSYEIKDDEMKLHFLNEITDYGKYAIDFSKRDIYSLFVEWKAHNILHNKGLFKKRTGDTGLEPKESWIRRLFYRMVCFLFSEK